MLRGPEVRHRVLGGCALLDLLPVASTTEAVLFAVQPPNLSGRFRRSSSKKKGLCRADAEHVDVLEQEMLVQKTLGRDASWVAPDCLRTLRIAHTVAQWLVSSCTVRRDSSSQKSWPLGHEKVPYIV